MKLKYMFYIFLFSGLLFAQEKQPSDETEDSLLDEGNDGMILITAGATYSSFVNTDNQADYSYQYGLSIRLYRRKALSLSSAVYYTHLKNKVFNLKAKYYNDNGNIYRAYYNLNFSAAFIKIPLLVNYDLIKKQNLILTVGAGPGFTIAFSNHSKVTDFEVTDEIIGQIPEGGVIQDYEDFTNNNSGFDFSVALTAAFYKYFALGVSYNIEFNKILNINYLNYYALNLSIKI